MTLFSDKKNIPRDSKAYLKYQDKEFLLPNLDNEYDNQQEAAKIIRFNK